MRLRTSVLGMFLLIPLLVGALADAQISSWKPYLFLNNVGGLNDAFDPTAIADTEAADLQNVIFSTGGAIVKRSGFVRLNTVEVGGSGTAAFTGLFMYKQADGDRFLVSTVSDGATDRIYAMDYGAGTSGPDGTWDNITGGLSLTFGTDDLADFAAAQDIVVIEDGVNTTAPYRWDGTGNAIALAGSPPTSRFVEYHKRILWTAGNDTNPSRVTFSNLDDISTWTGTDFFAIETSDGQTVTGLKSALDCLYVWKQASIFRICGTNRDDFTQEQMVTGIGTCSNASIVVINNQFIFTTCQGDIAVYDGGITVQFLSTKIEGTIAGLNQDRFDQAVAVAFDDGTGDEDYYLSLSASGAATHNRLLIFDTFHRAWTKFTGIAANAMVPYEVGTLQEGLAFGNYRGRANRYPSGDEDFVSGGATTSGIAAFYVTKQYSFPDIPQDKTFRLLEVFANQEGSWNLTATTRADFESVGTASTISLAGSGAVFDTAVFDTDTYADLTTVIGRVEINKRRRFLQIRYDQSGANQPATIKGWHIWVEPEGRI